MVVITKGGLLLAPNGQRPRILLNIPQDVAQDNPPATKSYQVQNSIMPRF